MSLFPSLCNFYNGQISTPLCSCPLACFGKSEKEEEREREREKKCPDEYTASQEDLLIGGSLSPSVVELRPNPSRRLNETVQIPRDGPRQQLLEWVGRMRSERERKRKAGPPPTVHAPSSHLNQSRKPGWPCLLWSLSSETSTFRIKMISSGPPPKTPQHTHTHTAPKSDWDSFFWQTLSVCISSPLLVLHVLSVSLSSKLKDWKDSPPLHLSRAKPRALGDHVLFLFLSQLCIQKTPAKRGTVLWPRRDDGRPQPPTPPTERSMLMERRDGGSRRVFLPFHFFSSDTARGHRRRDGGSFSLPPRSTIGLPATSPVIYDAVKSYTVFSVASTKGHRVVLDASIYPVCRAALTSKKRNN